MNGNEIWRRTSSSNSGLTDIVVNKNGNISYLNSIESLGLKLTVVDSLGNDLSQLPISFFSSRFCQLDNSSYIIVENSFAKDNIQRKVLSIDEKGKTLWEKTWSGAKNVLNIGNNRFILLGYDFVLEQHYLAEIDALGNQIWIKFYPQLNIYSGGLRANRILLNSFNEIIFTGDLGAKDQYFIAKADIKGTIKCINFIKFNEITYPFSMTPTKEKGALIVGVSEYITSNPNSENKDDIFVMKTDSLCNVASPVVVDVKSFVPDSILVYPDKFSFDYYPNPSVGQVYFDLKPTKAFDGTIHLEIFDLYGRHIFNKIVEQQRFDINILNQADGIYFFRFREGKQVLGKGKLIFSKN